MGTEHQTWTRTSRGRPRQGRRQHKAELEVAASCAALAGTWHRHKNLKWNPSRLQKALLHGFCTDGIAAQYSGKLKTSSILTKSAAKCCVPREFGHPAAASGKHCCNQSPPRAPSVWRTTRRTWGWGMGQDLCMSLSHGGWLRSHPRLLWNTGRKEPGLPHYLHWAQGSSQSAQWHRLTPTRNSSTYLFLPTDIADNRAWGRAWGRSQDTHHSFGENLTHCGHQREEPCIRFHPQCRADRHAYSTCSTLLRMRYHLLLKTYPCHLCPPKIPLFPLKHCHPACDTLLSSFSQPF